MLSSVVVNPYFYRILFGDHVWHSASLVVLYVVGGSGVYHSMVRRSLASLWQPICWTWMLRVSFSTSWRVRSLTIHGEKAVALFRGGAIRITIWVCPARGRQRCFLITYSFTLHSISGLSHSQGSHDWIRVLILKRRFVFYFFACFICCL
jgi:hypothetical protein